MHYLTKAALAALNGDQKPVELMNIEFKKRHDWFIGALNRLPGIVALPGAGAFYAWADCSAAMTAAAAVVFAPLASRRIETLNGPKNVCLTAVSTASAFVTFDPPMKMAVACKSAGPRVKSAPWTKDCTFSGVTAP